jgi:hypothetical protein
MERLRPTVCVVLLGLVGSLLGGCHESDLEPQSPLRGDWSMSHWATPAAAMPIEVPSLAVVDPAPISYRPRSISLGFIGDAPLTQTPYYGPRWPWVQEPFYYGAPAYAYGYGGYGRSRRGRRR